MFEATWKYSKRALENRSILVEYYEYPQFYY